MARLDALTGLTELERGLCRDAVLVLSTIRVEVDGKEYDASRERAAALCAAYLRGVNDGIDYVLGPPARAVTEGPGNGA